MKKRLTDREMGLVWGEPESKALLQLNPVNGKLDTKLRSHKREPDLALMSKQRNVSSLQVAVIGSDLMTFLPVTLQAGVLGSNWDQKMTPALGVHLNSVTLGLRIAMSVAWMELVFHLESSHLGSYRDQEPLGTAN